MDGARQRSTKMMEAGEVTRGYMTAWRTEAVDRLIFKALV